MLAGRPGDYEAAWRAAGVDGFIFAGGDAVAILDGLAAPRGRDCVRRETAPAGAGC